jgi:hypothetical protein
MKTIHRVCAVLLLPVFVVLLVFSTGCQGQYRYFSWRSKAEDALLKKKFKLARELYSTIYQQENKETGAETERTTWAFYRLGVIAEVMGDVQMAKGYYWGDKIDEGYYQEHPDTDWLAQAGWNWLDEGNAPRSIEEILDLEARGRPETGSHADRKKKELVIPETVTKPAKKEVPGESRPQRTFNRSLTPTSPGSPQPFRVFY